MDVPSGPPVLRKSWHQTSSGLPFSKKDFFSFSSHLGIQNALLEPDAANVPFSAHATGQRIALVALVKDEDVDLLLGRSIPIESVLVLQSLCGAASDTVLWLSKSVQEEILKRMLLRKTARHTGDEQRKRREENCTVDFRRSDRNRDHHTSR